MMDRLRSRLQTRTPNRSQDGYVLVTTLTAMLLCTVVIGSLLALTVSTVAVEESGRVRERQVRAAESAIETTLNEIRNDPSIAAANLPQLKGPGDTGYDPAKKGNEQALKDPSDSGYVADLDPRVNPELLASACNPVQNLIEVDSFPVRVYCYNEGLWAYEEGGGPKVPGLPADDGGVAVRLVGGAYQGDPDAADDPISDQARNWKSTFPFASAVQGWNAGLITSTQGQLVYTGATPLRITGGVEVKNEIAAVTAAGTPGPVLDVDGVVVQGGPGIADTVDHPCGIAEADDTLNSPRADVAASSIYSAPGTELICNEDIVATMGQGGLRPPDGADWDNARVQRNRYHDWDGNGQLTQAANPSLYDVMPTDCEALALPGGVISIPAGSYTAAETAIMNEWWSTSDIAGTPASPCPGRTFYFEGGPYYFDVYNPALPDSDPRQHSLTFANREINWVFGAAKGFLPAPPALTQFPDACDKEPPNPSSPDTSRGVTLTLSARTGIHHTAGRVAICGNILKQQNATDPKPAHETTIWQRSATSLGARVLPNALNAGTFSGTVNDIRTLDGSTIGVTQPVSPSCWDNGNCTYTHTFQATQLGMNAADGADPGPGPIGSVYVDVTADAEFTNNPNLNLAYTRIALNMKDGTNCFMRFGTPQASAPNRTPDNYATTSYNMMVDPVNDSGTDGIDGTCDTVLTPGMSRDLFRANNATVNVTVGLNPPPTANTKFGNNIFGGIIRWLCQNIAEPIGEWTGWYQANCDNRPPDVKFKVDAIAVRLGWTPTFDTPTSATGTCAPLVCVPINNPERGARETGTAQYATMNSFVTPTGISFGRLRYSLRDPNMVDGFLPLQTATLTAKINKPATANAEDKLELVLRTNKGVRCTTGEIFFSNVAFANNVETPWPITGCTQGDGGPAVPLTSLAIGDLVGHKDPADNDVLATLDVEIKLGNTNSVRTVQVDYATLTATAGDTGGVGYPRPKDPFTVTWNPLTPNGDGTARAGDATFNVFGSVSVPNNDVRVIFNWDANHSSGPVGAPIFNGGSVPISQCSPIVSEFCRPALVASALGSWTTGSWPANPTATQVPDPLASTGVTRDPFRRVRLIACVVDPDGTPLDGADDDLYPRAEVLATISDKDGNATSPGANVRVTKWNVLQNGKYTGGAVYEPDEDPCNVKG